MARDIQWLVELEQKKLILTFFSSTYLMNNYGETPQLLENNLLINSSQKPRNKGNLVRRLPVLTLTRLEEWRSSPCTFKNEKTVKPRRFIVNPSSPVHHKWWREMNRNTFSRWYTIWVWLIHLKVLEQPADRDKTYFNPIRLLRAWPKFTERRKSIIYMSILPFPLWRVHEVLQFNKFPD